MASLDLLLPYPIETDDIGDILEKEYRSKDPNTHITYFCVRLGNEIQQELQTNEKFRSIFKQTLKEVVPDSEQGRVKIWRPFEQGWKAQLILFIKFDLECENERQREDKLNKEVRERLIDKLKKTAEKSNLPPTTPIHVMFSRACLYTEYERDKRRKISTDRIGKILKNEYGVHDKEDTMIDYFYLFVQAEEDGKPITIHMQELAVDILKNLKDAGEWRIVENERTWEGMFYGFYPKSSAFMTERERERELYENVAQQLREKLLEKIMSSQSAEAKPKVHVIITRACEYNPTPIETPGTCMLL